MKNYMGIVWDRGYFHANNLQQCMPMYVPMTKTSTQRGRCIPIDENKRTGGRSLADVVLSKGLFISQDIVAVDTAAANFFNQVREMPLERVGHLKRGEELGIGTMDLEKLNIKRIRM